MAEAEELCNMVRKSVDPIRVEQLFTTIPALNALYEKVDEKLRKNPRLKVYDALQCVTNETSYVEQSEDRSDAYKDALYLTTEDDDFLYVNARMDEVCPYGGPLNNNGQYDRSGQNVYRTAGRAGLSDTVGAVGVSRMTSGATAFLPIQPDNSNDNYTELSTIDIRHLQTLSPERGGSSNNPSQRACRPRVPRGARSLRPEPHHGAPGGQAEVLVSRNCRVPTNGLWMPVVSQACSNFQQSQEISPADTQYPAQERFSNTPCELNPYSSSHAFSPAPGPTYQDSDVDTGCSFEEHLRFSSPCSASPTQVLSPYAHSSPNLYDSPSPSPYMNDLTFSSSYSSPACTPSPDPQCLYPPEDAPMTSNSPSCRSKKTGAKPKQRMPRMSLTGLTEEEKRLRVRDQNNKASREYRERRKEKDSFLQNTVNTLESEKNRKQNIVNDLQLRVAVYDFYFDTLRTRKN